LGHRTAPSASAESWYREHGGTHMRLVAKVTARPVRPKVQHDIGPPPELSGEPDHRLQMPFASVLLIESNEDGVFLFRFAADWRFAGDSWHNHLNDAQEQAAFEFENCLSGWTTVPDDVEDAVVFCLAQR